jgi:uncharacterized protein YecT (DUF1311 family)
MIRIIFLVALLPSLLIAQSQASMNLEASEEFKKADLELNVVFAQVLKRFESDSVVVNRLRQAQRAWLIFRDSHMESIFPDSDRHWYGTAMPMCYSMELTILTRARTRQLQQWSEGIQYGDVCAGSRPFKKE